MRTLKLTLQYDGTAYVGWQRQTNGLSVQARLEEALERIERRPVAVAGAGRTDAGVHALGQVASLTLAHPIEEAALQRALNAVLPADIRVVGVEAAPDGFHARYAAHAKTYRYRLVNGEVLPPFERLYAWHVAQPLDAAAMTEAAGLLVGRHDFRAFRAAGSAAKTTVRTIARAAWTDETAGAVAASGLTPPFRLLIFEIAGDGFLRHMVRGIVGTLVEVGARRREPADVARLLASGDRDRAGPTAPPHGLFLARVDY